MHPFLQKVLFCSWFGFAVFFIFSEDSILIPPLPLGVHAHAAIEGNLGGVCVAPLGVCVASDPTQASVIAPAAAATDASASTSDDAREASFRPEGSSSIALQPC